MNRTQHCIWGEGAGQRYKTIPGRLKLSIVEGGLCLRRRVGTKTFQGRYRIQREQERKTQRQTQSATDSETRVRDHGTETP